MSLNAPESYELDSAADALLHINRGSTDDEDSDRDESDPLRAPQRPYQDHAMKPLPGVINSENRVPTSRQRTSWRRRVTPSRFCWQLILLFFSALVLILSTGGLWAYNNLEPEYGQSEPWYPSPKGGSLKTWEESYRKAAVLVGQMTLVEKVNATTGIGWMQGMCVGNTGSVERLGFPSLCLQDGPLGLRFVDNGTAFPAGITVGATWNKELMYERGKAHGFEAKLKGIHVLLSPVMGPIGRLPAGGRNWEGFGADPVLQGIASAETIRGIQEAGVMATAKHFVGNEQERYRQAWEWAIPNAISSNIGDRAMREIYAWPFADAVRAGVASVMGSYNQVNNSYACQSSKLLNGILKDELGFQGFVQSDWLAQRSGVASALAGLDMTMPGDGLGWKDGKSLWGGELAKAVLNGSVPMDRINDQALRVVAAWYQLGQDNKTTWPSEAPNFSSWTDEKIGKLHPGSGSKETGIVNQFVPVRNTEEGGDHDALARKIAAEGIVMVKNEDDILPLSRKLSEIVTSGSTSKVMIGIFGEDGYHNPKGDNACPDRGCNVGTLAEGWGSGAVELPYLVAPADALHANLDQETTHITDFKKNTGKGIGQIAAQQDLCIVFINSDAGEGFIRWKDIKGDRNDFFSQKGGDKLVQNVATNCGGLNSNGSGANTIVVLHTVGPTILEKWIDHPGVKAVLVAHLPGQESGNALTDVLFGDVNPSGRLPYTIGRTEDDYGPDSKILRLPNGLVPQQDFTEGLYFDYRYCDKHGIAPRYEFGYGLSYNQYKLSSLFIHPLGARGEEPKPRPDGIQPPHLDTTIPDPSTALWPEGFKKLKKYIYPYIDNVASAQPRGPPVFPDGYDTPRPPSPAGGGEGGNPDLYEPAVTVQASLTNLGTRPGACVVQLYISYPPGVVDTDGAPVDMPVRVLRAFDKLAMGTTDREKRKRVSLTLTRKDLSYWDVKRQNWIMPGGDFTVYLGFSSRDLGQNATFSNFVTVG